MRKLIWCVVALTLCGAALAELQNIEVGGEVRIRGRYWSRILDSDGREARLTGGMGWVRPVGDRGGALGGLTSLVDFDDDGNDLSFVEQRTAINVKADFTDDVSAFIEFDDYERWGQDFRSNYLTGVDARANTADDVELIQAYIDVNEALGYPLRLRIGRQEIVMGTGWLVGSQVSPTLHMSYDGIRATYQADDFVVDAWWTKLAETSPLEEDGDVDFYGIYGTYTALEPVDISVYWLYVRDAMTVADTPSPLFDNFEEWLGLDDYGTTELHTIGLRVWGASNAFDYNLELAYQFGDASAVGATFPSLTWLGVYGDDGADFDNMAFDLEVGYTFDAAWQPRVYVGGAYFEGDDERDVSFWDWLNPFDQASASVSFNRLFSAKWYTSVFDILGGAANLSNIYHARVGVTVHPMDKVTAGALASYFAADEEFDWPAYVRLGNSRVPVAAFLPFWTHDGDSDLGVVSHVWAKYSYSEDLWIKVGWEHLFAGDGLYDGSFVKQNGLDLFAGSDDDDGDYVYFDMGLKF